MSIPKYKKILTPMKDENDDIRFINDIIEKDLIQIRSDYPILIHIASFLEPVPVIDNLNGRLGTDGKKLFYNPVEIMNRRYSTMRFNFLWQSNGFSLVPDILHIIFHGLLGHFEDILYHEHAAWHWRILDLEADRMEHALSSKKNDSVFDDLEGEKEFAEELEYFCQKAFDGSLYYEGLEDISLRRRLINFTRRFSNGHDDHRTWALPDRPKKKSKANGSQQEEEDASDSSKDSRMKEIAAFWREQRAAIAKCPAGQTSKEMADSIVKNLEQSHRHDPKYGNTGLGAEEEVEAAEDSILSYQYILDDLIDMKEISREEDNLDPILYSYGLELYDDVPLIEPLDMVDLPCLHTIVVAIDTSGSCAFDVPQFLRETIEIFDEVGRFGSVDSIHMVSCDTEIQDEEIFPDIESLHHLNKKYTFHGFGGTSFVPVFDKIKEYKECGETISCLIYFSDTYGDFPEDEPDYPVYFVLPTEDDEEEYFECEDPMRSHVPEWVKLLKLK